MKGNSTIISFREAVSANLTLQVKIQSIKWWLSWWKLLGGVNLGRSQAAMHILILLLLNINVCMSFRMNRTNASAFSRSVYWCRCGSGSRFLPHCPFSFCRSRTGPCSFRREAPQKGGRISFTTRAKWEKVWGSCLLTKRVRKAITSLCQAEVCTFSPPVVSNGAKTKHNLCVTSELSRHQKQPGSDYTRNGRY